MDSKKTALQGAEKGTASSVAMTDSGQGKKDNRDSDADVILKGTDGMEVPASKDHLASKSPFF